MPDARPWGVVQDADDAGPGLIATIARLRGIDLWIAPAGGLSDARQFGALVVLSGAAAARGLVTEAVDERVPVLAIGATSTVDPAPAFRLSRAYGLPFHLEVDADLAARSADGPPGYPTSASLRAGVAVFDAFARMALVPRTVSRRPPTSRRTP